MYAERADMPVQTLIELLRGKGAHADPVACVEDLSPEIAGRSIEHWPHTIWQLVCHMNYWMEYEINRIHGNPRPYPEHAAESWPVNAAPVDEGEWKAAVAQFANLLGQLKTIAASDSEVLERPVLPTGGPQDKLSSSVHAVLWQLVSHNSYHVGQIAMIRRALGVWPPRGGGDTW